ncbi:alpha/beta hydrolase [Nocardia colli]|uniref:Alpha/beta hydrolase n=1 Tax=Nocardia colli TaxID=2545717 RepID=A0A5N0EFP2_9NOCA|nr:alpha/beta hydrolase [Nocardia colli]KAA8887064.1 alpha/beta hydrolase [Nocardia colli]
MVKTAWSLTAAMVMVLLSGPVASAAPGSRDIPNVTYASVDGRDLKLDLYLPAAGAEPAPVVVYIFGGGWQVGRRDDYGVPMPWDLGQASKFEDLTKAGYTVAAVDYRYSTQAPWPAQIYDVKSSVRWLRANAATYGLDPDRIAALGESAGGHLAAMLGTSGDVAGLEGNEGVTGYSSRVQAAVSWFGATDLLTMDQQAPKDGLSLPHDAAASPEGVLLGGCAPSACPDRARNASPVSYVTPDDPPTLFQHGTHDHIVPFGQSLELQAALDAAGVPTELHGYDADHVFLGAVSPFEIRGTLINFLNRYLRKN